MTDPFIDPSWIKVSSLEEMTEAERAGKIVVHEHRLHGHTYLVYSKYDEQGVMSQRALIRKDLLKED
jgi:hypothetical protein